jgi:hypothetical protein
MRQSYRYRHSAAAERSSGKTDLTKVYAFPAAARHIQSYSGVSHEVSRSLVIGECIQPTGGNSLPPI